MGDAVGELMGAGDVSQGETPHRRSRPVFRSQRDVLLAISHPHVTRGASLLPLRHS